MKLKDIKMNDLETLYKMYEEFESFSWVNNEDTDDFLDLYVQRCECCNEIVWSEDLTNRTTWKGNDILCCLECQRVIDDE